MKRYESRNNKDLKKDSLNNTKDEDFDFEIRKWMEEINNEETIEEENLSLKEEDELLNSISESLGRQVRSEIKTQEVPETVNRSRRFPPWFKAVLVTLVTCIGISLLLILTPFGRDILWHSATDYAYGKMNYDDGQNTAAGNTNEESQENTAENTQETQSVMEPPTDYSTVETVDNEKEGITNILLLGEEAIESEGANGRTDIMMIATMNSKEKSIKLTSLMRDTLVQIPGNKDNKLNAAYEIGGVPLLYETIKLNFGLELDGYVKVGFDDFEKVIDKLGGVPITLTKREAAYLNSTNYISKPEYRNVKEGYQILNGNQALGYCRIRYVATGDDQINDFGRTSRQRTVLNAVYEQYKAKSLPELLLLMNDILPIITTDITKDEFDFYLETAMTLMSSKIQTLRIPADNTFEEGYIRSMSVLIPNLSENSEILHEFIYGNSKEDNK